MHGYVSAQQAKRLLVSGCGETELYAKKKVDLLVARFLEAAVCC